MALSVYGQGLLAGEVVIRKQCGLLRCCEPNANPKILYLCWLIPQTGKVCTIKKLASRVFHSG